MRGREGERERETMAQFDTPQNVVLVSQVMFKHYSTHWKIFKHYLLILMIHNNDDDDDDDDDEND